MCVCISTGHIPFLSAAFLVFADESRGLGQCACVCLCGFIRVHALEESACTRPFRANCPTRPIRLSSFPDRCFTRAGHVPVYVRECDIDSLRGAFPFLFPGFTVGAGGGVPQLEFRTFADAQPFEPLPGVCVVGTSRESAHSKATVAYIVSLCGGDGAG